MVYLLKGSLPWRLHPLDTINIPRLRDIKLNCTPEDIVSDLPEPFLDFGTYVYNLGFYEEPDYEYMKFIL